jgi:hypothetical protein
MRPLARGVALCFAPCVAGCSFGLFQTAHTQPPGQPLVTVGLTKVKNAIDEVGGRTELTSLGLQAGARVGVLRRLDLGVGSFFLSGGRADVKVNLVDPTGPFALSPRAGIGYQHRYGVLMAEAGGIASYRFFGMLEPYAGLTFANHWLTNHPPPSVNLPRSLAPGTGTGDGLLQAAVGLAFDTKRHVGFMAEYGHWFVMQDDPADFYAFVPTNVLGVALRVYGQ